MYHYHDYTNNYVLLYGLNSVQSGTCICRGLETRGRAHLMLMIESYYIIYAEEPY